MGSGWEKRCLTILNMHDAIALSVTAFRLHGPYFEPSSLPGGARFVGVDDEH